MDHDWAGQKRETFETFAEMDEGLRLPARAVVYFEFYAEDIDCDWQGVETALRGRGFATERDEDEGLIVASIGPIAVTPEAIWREEKRATEAALPFDFIPDGWELSTDEE